MSTKFMAAASLAALCGCAGMTQETREPAVERLEQTGVSSPVLQLEAGRVLRFVNADSRPHQIYSHDCGEVSSPVLRPGDDYSMQLGAAGKVCHFQDLLAPLDTGYSGTVRIEGPVARLGIMDVG